MSEEDQNTEQNPENMFTASLQRMLRLARERDTALRAFLETQPQSIQCTRHAEVRRNIDPELSRAKTIADGHHAAEYSLCPGCERELEIERQNKLLHWAGVPLNLLHATIENWKPENEAERQHL